ncbi:MAG: MBL fold metallo-hydrolase [Gammaproteobacteria bacterium]
MNAINCSFLKAASMLFAGALLLSACQSEPEVHYDFAAVCEALPNEENARLSLADASDDWFQVYEAAEGVYSIAEPYHIQGTISHLIIGSDRAILFDTGIGLLPIRPVVERITDLPVSVLNSHTHYDHVGGNAEFSSVFAIDSEYTRANMAGFTHSRIAEDFAPDAFCDEPPGDVDLTAFHTQPWKASRYVEDGEILELGGRRLEILHVPGHTPDATALLDAENGLLFTGDSFYDAELWLFVPETSLDDYDRAISRLAGVESEARYLLGAHTSARVDAGRLSQVKAAFEKLRKGDFDGELNSGGRSYLSVDGIEFVTSQQVLDGKQGDTSKGGSGLDTWN